MPDQSYEQQLQGNYAKNKAWAKPSPGGYLTQLTPEQNAAFLQWVKENNVNYDPTQKIQDYDMPGFYLALMQGNKIAKSGINPYDKQIHYPDYWKTPYDKTFSNQSQWALPTAPKWSRQGRYLLDSTSGKILFDSQKDHEQ